MQQLTPQGQQIVNDLASAHGFSTDAITHMLYAVLNGNGSMAQFNHWEFGGSGQWMRGGMMMLGDMFNSGLKFRVESLCNAISDILANQPGLLQSGSFQSQSQSGSAHQSQHAGSFSHGNSSLFVPDPEQNWWPSELGNPSATGNQNNVRYAYFANQSRLAVKTGGEVWVYDTRDHAIGGFSQQQGSGGSITFTSQYGTVDLNTLQVVSRNGQAVSAPPPPAPPMAPPPAPMQNNTQGASSGSSDVFSSIERLGQLRDQGILSEEEFSSKKAELLARL